MVGAQKCTKSTCTRPGAFEKQGNFVQGVILREEKVAQGSRG